MTTLLPRDQVDFLRSIGDAAQVLIALILIDRCFPGRATKADELAMILGKDSRPIEKRLNALCASNRVCRSGNGYVLLEGGRALLLAGPSALPAEVAGADDDLEFTPKALAPSPDNGQAPSPVFNRAPQVQAPGTDTITVPLDEIINGQLEDCEQIDGEPPDDDSAHTMCVPLEEEEVNTDSNKSEYTSSIDSSTQNAQSPRKPAKPASGPSTLEILDQTRLLFGKSMTTRGLESVPRRMAIGWVAQAYDQRHNLRSPQGLIYSRLSARAQPQAAYYDHPRDFLPEEYLQALGLEAPSRAQVPAYEMDPDDPDVVPAGEIDMPNETLDQPIEGTRHTPATAWEAVLEQLKQEMHRAPFDTWVKDTNAVRYHQETIFVSARNGYTRDWLESRVQTTVERALIGVLGRPVAVKFIVEDK